VVPTQDQLQDAARGARDRGALWRFEKDGRHGYLYGTIHIANLDWAMPGPTVGRALSEVETVAIEADPADPATGAGMAAPQKPQEAPSLPAALLDELHRSGQRVFAAAGILHMVGDTALQKLLAERGFKIERAPLRRR
jgi:uncharacterized protein YbaP (TraB family)